MRRKHLRSPLVLLTAGALAMGGAALSQEQEQTPQEQETVPQEQEEAPQLIPRQGDGLPAGQVPAVLKVRDANFVYRSSARQLTCDQLRQRVALILSAIGARQDIEVSAHECETFLDPSNVHDTNRSDRRDALDPWSRSQGALDRTRPYRSDPLDRRRTQSTPVRIRMMMPMEATPDIVEEVDKDRARRELVSRVTGNPGAAMNNPIFFAAERQQVELSYDTLKLESIDCELLEQMSRTVFRELDVKVTRQSLSCDPRERSRIKPSLTVEALLPVGFQLPKQEKKKVEGSISIP
jgi:hypothetical protein